MQQNGPLIWRSRTTQKSFCKNWWTNVPSKINCKKCSSLIFSMVDHSLPSVSIFATMDSGGLCATPAISNDCWWVTYCRTTWLMLFWIGLRSLPLGQWVPVLTHSGTGPVQTEYLWKVRLYLAKVYRTIIDGRKKSIKISNAAFAFAICEASQQTNNSVICAGSSAGGRVAITGGGENATHPSPKAAYVPISSKQSNRWVWKSTTFWLTIHFPLVVGKRARRVHPPPHKQKNPINGRCNSCNALHVINGKQCFFDCSWRTLMLKSLAMYLDHVSHVWMPYLYTFNTVVVGRSINFLYTFPWR